MNKDKTLELVTKLMKNAEGLRYGTVSMSVKLHDGRVVEVSYTKTEQTRDTKTKQDNPQ